MTLHIRTITPDHIIYASDRLLYTPPEFYVELQDDQYKHLLFVCDNAKAVIGFTGFAGTSGNSGMLKESTTGWIKDVLLATSKKSHDLNIHLSDLAKLMQRRVDYLRSKYRFDMEDLKVAVQVSGWCQEGPFDCIVENYQNQHCHSEKTRDKFTVRIKKYFDPSDFSDGPQIMIQGERALADRQAELFEELEGVASTGEPKLIFDTSVKLIRAVAGESNGTVGFNCSGARLSRDDPFMECYDDRDDTVWDVVMPDVVKSTSKFSGYVGGFRGKNSIP